VALAEPKHDGWEVFHILLLGSKISAQLCAEVHLAALAIANGWDLVSFDRDFERFEGLDQLNFLAEISISPGAAPDGARQEFSGSMSSPSC